MGVKIVTHIDRRVGDRGGEYWWLTLECGHLKAVRIPKFRPQHVMSLRRIPLAPKKVKCLVCEPSIRILTAWGIEP